MTVTANRSLMRRLVHRLDIERSTDARSGSGQVNKTWSTHLQAVCCLFTDGSQTQAARNTTDALLYAFDAILPPDTDITTLDRVVNVVDHDGNVIEAGPLSIEDLTKPTVARGRGGLHHIRIGLEKRS